MSDCYDAEDGQRKNDGLSEVLFVLRNFYPLQFQAPYKF